jgi:hypothetical protein
MKKRFKEFLENYDVYMDMPINFVTSIESGSAVPINAPETVTKNPKSNKPKSKKKTEESPIGKNEIY